jgi:hypothetical protein
MLKKILEDKKMLSDIILIGTVLIIALSAFLIYMGTREKINPNEAYVSVSVDGKEIAKYSLSIDGVYYITGYNGGTNVLVIENGEAYVSEASCPQNTSDVPCTRQGKISADSIIRSIECLPNRVSIRVIGGNEGGLYI